jgi:acyl-coenzyme A synthetase/AMP-(fatty) acid ligase
MTWQSVAAFLACARIGAVHSVVFAGFSAESLRDRVQECKSRVVLRYHVQSLTHLQSHPALAMRSVQRKIIYYPGVVHGNYIPAKQRKLCSQKKLPETQSSETEKESQTNDILRSDSAYRKLPFNKVDVSLPMARMPLERSSIE